ncbi:MAG TPA: DUF4129 domain-containing protein [Patescibacteria group bacterium]|nr:DUF4129 domain-containing protein [Patescibacteria group bacterium]
MSRADGLFPAAVGLAEGGWVAVVYLLVDAIARVDAPLSPVTFVVVAGLACAAAGWLDRLAASRLTVIVGLLVGGGLLGIVLSAASAATFGGRDPVAAATHDPGAVLLGLAALRGFIRAGAQRDPGQAARPFLVGLVGLAAAWIFAGALSEPMRSTFRDAAVLPTIAFVVGGLASTGLASSALASTGAGFDPLANRPWVVAMLGLAVGLGVAALPMGAGLERMMAALIAWPLTLPLVIFGAIVARVLVPSRHRTLRRTTLWTVGPFIAFAVLAILAVIWPRRDTGPAPEESGGGGIGPIEPDTPAFNLILTVVAVVVVIGVLLFLARAWRRNAELTDRPGVDGRSRAFGGADTDLGDGPGWGSRLRRLVGRGRPTDAVTAYLAALRTIESDEELRREPAETPAQHAHRLHGLGFGSLELDLLAADFELARWGGRRLSGSEDRRALGRLERFRRQVADRLPDG